MVPARWRDGGDDDAAWIEVALRAVMARLAVCCLLLGIATAALAQGAADARPAPAPVAGCDAATAEPVRDMQLSFARVLPFARVKTYVAACVLARAKLAQFANEDVCIRGALTEPESPVLHLDLQGVDKLGLADVPPARDLLRLALRRRDRDALQVANARILEHLMDRPADARRVNV